MRPSPPSDELARRQAHILDDLLGLRIRSPQARAADFADPPLGTVESRWGIYASGFLARLVEALENVVACSVPQLDRMLDIGGHLG